MAKIIRSIDSFTEWSGQAVKWLILVLIGIMTYEVIARYVFNSPTAWAFDLSYMIGGSMMILGGGYVVLHDGHVRVDLLYNKLSARRKLLLDLVFTLLVFCPTVAVLVKLSFQYGYHSWVIGERSRYGVWEPLLFPFRFTILLGFSLLLLEGISWFLRNLCLLIGRGKT